MPLILGISINILTTDIISIYKHVYTYLNTTHSNKANKEEYECIHN